jgi:hypothetical protein
MELLTPEVDRLVTKEAPLFIPLVAKASNTKRRLLRLPVAAFDDNPFLIYACICYAEAHGVSVSFPNKIVGQLLDLGASRK